MIGNSHGACGGRKAVGGRRDDHPESQVASGVTLGARIGAEAWIPTDSDLDTELVAIYSGFGRASLARWRYHSHVWRWSTRLRLSERRSAQAVPINP